VLHQILEQRLREATSLVLPDVRPEAIQVRPCPDPKFGDYQTASLIALAKERKANPRQLAADVVAKLEVSDWCERVEIAGAGFLNFRLKTSAVAATLEGAARGEHLFYRKTAQSRTVVVDFSSPNVAKPMHVGHIRSTILGDCLGGILRLLGHRVITDNHIGDWGTQFGKLLVVWKRDLNPSALQRDPIGEMERLYKMVNAATESDPAVLEQARQELVKLQRGDPENLRIWREMQALSQAQFDAVYARLRVKFDHTHGESFYNPKLPAIVQELREKGLAQESAGAICVFSDGSLPPKQDPFLKQEDGQWKPNPALIQKSDGGFNYTTTDLATLAYRLETWHPDEILYVTGGPQQLHFQQLFAIFRRWHPEAKVKLAHIWFGSILGEDGKPFKTRSGDTVKLAELLDEAEERAFKVVSEKSPELTEEQRHSIARIVGVGAVKYADLLPNRQTDYTFSWERMLALNGNTAPYLQYAYARIRSIFRKAAVEAGNQDPAVSIQSAEVAGAASAPAIALSTLEEAALGKHLLNFGLVLEAVAEEYRPNYLCNYLYDLAGHFTRFYEKCPVLKAPPAERASRLALCELTGRVLKQGLEVLGIETLDQM